MRELKEHQKPMTIDEQVENLKELGLIIDDEEYARRIGINPKTLYEWKKKEEFNDYIHDLCRKKFASMERLALKELKEQVENGNWKAIEYVLNGVGYKATEKLEVTDTTTKITIT